MWTGPAATGYSAAACATAALRRRRGAAGASPAASGGRFASPRALRPARAKWCLRKRPVAVGGLGDLLGRPLGDDAAAALAPLGPEIEDPVGGLDDVEIVLDDHHRVALVDQGVQHLEQLADIVEVEPGGRLVEDVEGLAGGPPRQLLGQLDALRLAAREGGRPLADMDVAEADALHRVELVADRRNRAEERHAFLHGHVKNIGDRFVLEQYFQRLSVVALALAHVALDVDVGQEVHFDLDDAVALAGFAAAALDVEREAPGLVAAGAGFGQAGEPVADRREGAGIGGRIGARRPPDRRLVDVDDLVDELQPFDPAMGAGRGAGVVEAPRDAAVEGVDDEGRFAAARDPGDAGEGAQRDAGGEVLEIVLAGAHHGEAHVLAAGAADHRHGHLLGALEVASGEAFGAGGDRPRRAFGDDVAAVDAGPGTHVDDVVGGLDRLLVMLHDQHRIAEVAQALEGLEQARIVALVQADRRLVEDVQHPGQSRADLRGEADALALAARQRAGCARQGEVLQADIDQEAQPALQLAQDAPGDLALLGGQRLLEPEAPMPGGADRHLRHLSDMQRIDLDGQGFRLEAIAVAGRAGRRRLVASELLADPVGIGFLPAPLHVGHHALEGAPGGVAAPAVVVGERHPLLAGAVKKHVAGLLGQVAERHRRAEAVVLREAGEGLGVEAGGRVGPRRDRAAVERAAGIGHHEVGIDVEPGAEPVAGGAGAEGVVEGEQPGLDLLDGEARHRAGEARGKQGPPAAVGVLGDGQAVAGLERGLEAVGEAPGDVGRDDEAVDHDLDRVLALLVEGGRVLDLVELAVDLDALEAALEQVGEILAVLALAPAHDRREQIEPGAGRHRQDEVDHLRHGLAFDRQARGRRVGDADAREQ